MSVPKIVTPSVRAPDLSTAVTEDTVAYQNIPLLFKSPVVQVHTKTNDSSDKKTKLYVQTQVYSNFEYSVNNAKNLFGTILAAGVLVYSVSTLISKEKEDMAEKIADGAETVSVLSGIAFSAAHLLNAVVANASNKNDDSKYAPGEVPNVYLSKN